MRRILIVFLLFSCTLSIRAQKVWVGIAKSKIAAESSWQIMDVNFIPVLASSDFISDDSIPFSLEANKRYILELSVTQINNPDTILARLYINSEPILLLRSDIGPGDHFYYFFTGIRQEVRKIAGGTDTDIADFPWQVYLEAGNFTCGGSIISGDWIITAAHCTEDDFGNIIPASQMSVVVGANNPAAGEGKKYLVSQVIRNENYDSNTLTNDIALLKLSETINYVNATPIKLISANDAATGYTDPGVMCLVTGYGLTRVRPPAYPTTLQKVQLPIVTNAQASVVWPDIPSTDVMAGYLNGGKDACAGDSGGPLVVPVGTNYKLAGIVSWGSSNCNTYGAYTRVSLFESWITSKTGIEISFTPPVPTGDSIICPGVIFSTYSIGNIQGATLYDWQLQPSGAGSITGTTGDATVTWNQNYKGAAAVMIRVTRNNNISDWSVLYVHLARSTRVISQSKDTILCAKQPVVISVNSEGYNLEYSWFRNDTLVKKSLSNLVNFNSTITANTGVYICDVTGSCGSDTSVQVALLVHPLTLINSISSDSEIAFGGATTLSVDASGHNLGYQWMKDGSNLTGSNGHDFRLENVTAGNTGLYSVTVKGTCGTLQSSNVYVYVRKQDFNGDPEIFVWPTHSSNSVNVALSQTGKYNIRVFSVSGRLVMEKTGCQYVSNVDLSSLGRGVYILMIYNNSLRRSVKVIRD